MLDLHMGDEYYRKLRDSYFELKIEDMAQNRTERFNEDIYIKKIF